MWFSVLCGLQYFRLLPFEQGSDAAALALLVPDASSYPKMLRLCFQAWFCLVELARFRCDPVLKKTSNKTSMLSCPVSKGLCPPFLCTGDTALSGLTAT